MCSPSRLILPQKHTHHDSTKNMGASPPRKKVTLQRHRTFPGPLRSLPSPSASSVKKNTLRHNKKNPYVGWFRHAPPTLVKQPHPTTKGGRACHVLLSSSSTTLKFCKTTDARTLRRHHLGAGTLRGGMGWWQVLEQQKEDHSSSKAPPPVAEAFLSDAEEETLDGGETITLFEDDDDASIRSDTRLDDLYVNSTERLDYEITQMDIVRMNRVASRHLDVESIAGLPIVTFQAEQQHCKSASPSSKAFSWMLVHSDSETSEDDNDTEKGNVVCIICCEEFVTGDRLRVLPCSHRFHTGCIDRWLSGTNSNPECFTAGCPTCKKKIPSQSYFRVGDALSSHSFMAA